MKRNLLWRLALAPAVLVLASCSGLPQGNVCPGGVCNNGNANVSLTLIDAPPANTSIVNLNVPVIGISLTPQSGAVVALLSTPTTFEISRLQSDSSFVGKFQVPAGTYTSINVNLGAAFAVFVNSSNALIGNCNPLSVCHLASGAPGTISVTFNPALVVSGGQNIGLGVEFNLNNAITTLNGITIDLKQANVVTVVALPRAGQTSGTLDTVEDFTGIVTAASATSVTIQSATHGTSVFTPTSSTLFNDPLGVAAAKCPGGVNISCVKANQTISVDATVSNTGALNLTEVDFIDLPSVDELEGIISTTPAAGVYELTVADKTLVSGNATLAPVGSATTLFLTLDPAVTFAVDTKSLPISTPVGFAGTNDILDGQVVMARVKSATLGSGNINVVSDRLLLRFTRVSGTLPNGVAGNAFNITNLPPYVKPLNVPTQVQTYVNVTTFDGVSDINGLAANDSVSIRALYLHAAPTFLAAKVRKH